MQNYVPFPTEARSRFVLATPNLTESESRG